MFYNNSFGVPRVCNSRRALGIGPTVPYAQRFIDCTPFADHNVRVDVRYKVFLWLVIAGHRDNKMATSFVKIHVKFRNDNIARGNVPAYSRPHLWLIARLWNSQLTDHVPFLLRQTAFWHWLLYNLRHRFGTLVAAFGSCEFAVESIEATWRMKTLTKAMSCFYTECSFLKVLLSNSFFLSHKYQMFFMEVMMMQQTQQSCTATWKFPYFNLIGHGRNIWSWSDWLICAENAA